MHNDALRPVWKWQGRVKARCNGQVPIHNSLHSIPSRPSRTFTIGTQFRRRTRHMKLNCGPICLLFVALPILSIAQATKPSPTPPPRLAPVISPDVHADGSVTFRFRAPNAIEVQL